MKTSIIKLAILTAAVITFAGCSHSPSGKYIFPGGTKITSHYDIDSGHMVSSRLDVPGRYVEFYSSSKCRARLNVFADGASECRWKITGNQISIYDNLDALVQTFTYDSKFDELLATEKEQRWLYAAENPRTKEGKQKQRCLKILKVISLAKFFASEDKTPLTEEKVNAQLQGVEPKCPSEGKYSYNLEDKFKNPTCSIPGHVLEKE